MSYLPWPPSSILGPGGEEFSREKRLEVQACRLLSLFGAALRPLFGTLLSAANPEATDPMWVRLGLSTLFASLLGASYVSGAIRRRFPAWIRGMCYIIVVWFCSVVAVTGPSRHYDMALLLLDATLPFVVALVTR